MDTPYYLIDEDKFIDNLRDIEDNFNRYNINMEYALSVKTNNLPLYITNALKRNWKMEVVSEDEYELVKKCGCNPTDIIVNGPQKYSYIEKYLNEGATINIDNFREVELLCKNNGAGKKVGIRVNFDIDSMYGQKTKTNLYGSRFGFCYENGDVEKCIYMLKGSGYTVNGFHAHISSVTRDVSVYCGIVHFLHKLSCELGIEAEYIDIGGGFFGGRKCQTFPTMEQYSNEIYQLFSELFDARKTKLIMEPGASVFASSADYCTSVIDVKIVRGERIVTVDGTVLDIKPFMQSGNREYCLKNNVTEKVISRQWVVGATCLENDCLLELINERELNVGDIIIIKNVGAYTMSFNNYFINRPCKIFVKRDEHIELYDRFSLWKSLC